MTVSYIKRWVVEKPTESSFEALLESTWKDAETEIKKMGKNKMGSSIGRG